MRVMTSLKKTIFLAMVVLLLGFFVACSNSNDQLSEPNDNRYRAEDNDSGDHQDEHLIADDASNGNRLELGDEEKLVNTDKAGFGEHANNSDESNNASEDIDTNEANNTINETNTDAEGDGHDKVTSPSLDSNDHSPDKRPTLRSPVKSDDDPRTLTIGMFYMDSNSQIKEGFREIYTRAFEWQHPNVEIDFTSVIHEQSSRHEQFSIDVTTELRKMITGDNPPDVLFLGYNDYLTLMEEDLFVGLNPFFVDSELSLDDFEPIVADGLVNPQDGQTYGLSPYFNASALIYNKDLFDEMNVPYPHDHMTWEEVFTLAKQMTIRSEEKNVYGFAFDLHNHGVPSLSDIWRYYAHGFEVGIYDKETEKPIVNNDQWADILTSVKDLYDAGVFPTESENNQISRSNPFYLGTIAMAIAPYDEIRRIIDDTISGQQLVPNWDVVTVPVDPKHPHIGAGVVMEPVIVINANGNNQLDAWRLIESIHGKEWARMNEERLIRNISSRKDHAVNLAEVDYNKAAFYQLRPAKNHPRLNSLFGIVDLNSQLLSGGLIGYSKFLAGEIDVYEALEDLEFWVNFNVEKSKEFKSAQSG